MQYRIVAAPAAKDNWQRVISMVVHKLNNNDYCLWEAVRTKEITKLLDQADLRNIKACIDGETSLVKTIADKFGRALNKTPWMVFRSWNEMGFSGRDVSKEGFLNRVAEKFLTKTYLHENRFPCFDVDHFRTEIRGILAVSGPLHDDVANESDSDDDLQPIQISYHDGTQAGRLTHLIDQILGPVWSVGDNNESFRVQSQLLTVLADELGVNVKVPTSLDNNNFELRSKVEIYLSKYQSLGVAIA